MLLHLYLVVSTLRRSGTPRRDLLGKQGGSVHMAKNRPNDCIIGAASLSRIGTVRAAYDLAHLKGRVCTGLPVGGHCSRLAR